MAKKGSTRRITMPGDNRFSKYDNWSLPSDNSRTKAATKTLKTWSIWLTSALVLLIAALVVSGVTAGSVGEAKKEATEAFKATTNTPTVTTVAGSDNGGGTQPSNTSENTPDGYNPPSSVEKYVLPDGSTITGTTQEGTADISTQVSENVAAHYKLPFLRFYVLGKSGENYVMGTGEPSFDGQRYAFLAHIDGNGVVSDNYYEYKYRTGFGAQGWRDYPDDGDVSYAGVPFRYALFSFGGVLTPSGLPMDSYSSVLKTPGADVTFIVDESADISPETIKGLIKNNFVPFTKGDGNYARDFTLTFVKTNKNLDDFSVHTNSGIGLTFDTSLTYYNYGTMLSGSITDTKTYTVTSNGEVK